MTKDQLNEARKLYELGVPVAKIARQLGVATATMRYNLVPGEREKSRVRCCEYANRRRASDPEYRSAQNERAKAYQRKLRAAHQWAIANGWTYDD